MAVATGTSFSNSTPWSGASTLSSDQGNATNWTSGVDVTAHDTDQSHDFQYGPVNTPATPVGSNPVIEQTGFLNDNGSAGWAPNDSYGVHNVPTTPAINGETVSGIHELGDGYYQFSPQPQIGHPYTTTQYTPSYSPAFEWDSSTGREENIPAERVGADINFTGLHDSGYNLAPRFFTTEYSPAYLNIAEIPSPVTTVSGLPSGLLPDGRAKVFASEIYQSPPDPQVTAASSADQAAPATGNYGEAWR